MALIIWKYHLRQPSKVEKEWYKQELEAKSAKLKVVIEQARSFLEVIEADRLKMQEANEDSEAAAAAAEAEMNKVDRFLLKLGGGQRRDEEFKIRFIDMWTTCREVQAYDRCHELLPEGLDLAGQILSMELTQALTRTLKYDLRYANGERLKDRLNLALSFRYDCQRMRSDFSREQVALIDRHFPELVKKYVAGWAILGKQQKLDIFHAMQLAATCKRELGLELAASSLIALKGLLGALETLYITEAYELLRTPNFVWADLRRKLKGYYGVFAVKTALESLAGIVHHMGQQTGAHKLRTLLYSALLHQDFEWYRIGQTDARDMKYIFESIFSLPQSATACTSAFTSMIEKIGTAVGQVAIVLSKSSSLFRTMVLLESLGFFFNKGIDCLARYVSEDIARRHVNVNIEWFEPLSPEHLATTRSCTAERRTLINWERFWGSQLRRESLQDIVRFIAQPLHTLAGSVTLVGSAIRTAQLLKGGKLVATDIEAVRAMSTSIVNQGRGLIDSWAAAKEKYGPLARSWEIISVKPTIGLEGGIQPSGRAKGEMVFEHVDFKYEDGPPAVVGVSFCMEAGKVYALTGSTGSGKSTIFKLLQRFHDVQKGRILLDGTDIRDYNPIWLRQQIGVVDQRPHIFNLPLRDNLIYGCAEAGIYDLIVNNKDRFPAGLYTRVSAHTLSGGELQRVAIARALLKNAPILLLDEATSALDSHTQTAVKGAITKLMQGRTTVMIAHRLETIKEADQILVLKKGKVVESGSHAELVAGSGHYSELYYQQVTDTIVGDSLKLDKQAGPTPGVP